MLSSRRRPSDGDTRPHRIPPFPEAFTTAPFLHLIARVQRISEKERPLPLQSSSLIGRIFFLPIFPLSSSFRAFLPGPPAGREEGFRPNSVVENLARLCYNGNQNGPSRAVESGGNPQ